MTEGSLAVHEDNYAPRLAFVMEQTLGHVTHYTNMRDAIDFDSAVRADWYPLGFEPSAGVETLPVVRTNWTFRASWRARRTLDRARARSAYDALYFHTQVTTLLSVALMRQVPSVVSLDATPLNYDAVGIAYGHCRSNPTVEGIKRALNMRSLHAARAVITWCDWAKQSLINDYGVDASRISVIAPGVNLDLWPVPVPRDAGNAVRILFVGGDFERKGGKVLLRSFSSLAESCELHLVTQAQVDPAPGVHVYRDVTPNSEVLRGLYATADIFALPTLADCFPLAIQEAMAAGLPVIASNVGAIGEAVHDGETGLLVEPDSVASLRAALDCLVREPARRVAMGRCGREVAERQYDSAANAKRIVSIMTGLVGGE